MTTTATATDRRVFEFALVLEEAAPGEDGAPAEESWEFTALGLPYEQELKRTDWHTGATRQKFAKNSVTVAENNQVFYGHDWQVDGLPIGRITALEQTDAGPKITGRISQTAKGAEVRTLMLDGVLIKVSAGLITTAWHLEEEGDLLVHDASEAFEWSIVPQPAFDSADVTGVHSRTAHHKEQHMSGTATLDPATLASAADLQNLTESVNALERQVQTLPSTLATSGPAAVPFHSYAHFIKSLAAGDDEALKFAKFVSLAMREQDDDTTRALSTLAYEGGTTEDLGGWLKDSWIGDTFRLATANRKLHEFFASSPLPATGNNVEFGMIDQDTTEVEKQAEEGDVLAYGKINFTTDTAPVDTFGGWGEMTRQQIERSPFNVVEKFFTALLRRYAQVTEAGLKAAYLATVPHVLTGTGVHDLATPAGWNSFLIDSAIYLEDTYGLAPEAIILGWDVYKTLTNMTMPSANDYFLDRANGTINLSALSGDVHTIKLLPISTGATTGHVRVAHSEAIRTLESGSPTQLTDGDITNLTNAYSIYGYEAIAPEEPGLLVAPDATA